MLNSTKAKIISKFAGATLQRLLPLSPQFSWASVELPFRLHQVSLPESLDHPTQPLTPDRDPVKHRREIVTRDGTGVDPKLSELPLHQDGNFEKAVTYSKQALQCLGACKKTGILLTILRTILGDGKVPEI
jgi:hypothetical protein